MKIKVEALEEWKKQNLKCKDLKPERIPQVGEQWEVNEDRLQVLLGKNSYKKAFVKVVQPRFIVSDEQAESAVSAIEHLIEETTKEKPIKKSTAKKQPKKK